MRAESMTFISLPHYGDITHIRTESLPDFDLLVGGFPCKSFSTLGRRQGFDDPRGLLFFEVARILRDKQPRFFLLENVKGLVSHRQGATFRVVIQTLEELGYGVQWQVLDSQDFGVSQHRERVYLVGALGVSRATYYRRQKPARDPSHRKLHPRQLSKHERQRILDTLWTPEFADLSPYQVYAILLERGTFLGSIRTMYRLLEDHQATKDRRGQRTHPVYHKPQLVATAPNQIWTWDISKIAGPRRGACYSLYVALDLFSCYVVSWLLAQQESASLAKRLIGHGTRCQGVVPNQLTIHADRGSPMTSSGRYSLFKTLGITGSHSRPRVSNDNAFSEAQFKTLKYHRAYSKWFENHRAAETYFEGFFEWYNREHHHVGLGLFTPAQIHSGAYQHIQTVRQ